MEKVSSTYIHSNQMVSLDVVSLFTRVPTCETLTVVRDKLAVDPSLEKRTCIPIYNLIEMLIQSKVIYCQFLPSLMYFFNEEKTRKIIIVF